MDKEAWEKPLVQLRNYSSVQDGVKIPAIIFSIDFLESIKENLKIAGATISCKIE